MKRVLLFLMLAVPLQAADSDVTVASTGVYFPQVVDSAEWRTEITITNLDNSVISYDMQFYGDDGLPLMLNTNQGSAVAFYGTLPPYGGSRIFTTDGTSPTMTQGWARISSYQNMGVRVLLRRVLPGHTVPELETVFSPSRLASNRYMIPIDNQSSTLALAFVNPSPFSWVTVQLAFVRPDGSWFRIESIDIPPYGHKAFVVEEQFPETAGFTGTIAMFGTLGQFFYITGLRATSSGSLASVEPLVNPAW